LLRFANQTPTIDRLAAHGLRYTGFHTTAMCSTTRAARSPAEITTPSCRLPCELDGGFPGYRGKIAKEAGTLAEMLRPHAYRNYMVGKMHVTPLTEVGATGPFDGWPWGADSIVSTDLWMRNRPVCSGNRAR